MADLLANKMDHKAKSSCILYNGYDKELFDNIQKNDVKNVRFIMSHIGLMGPTQRLDSFIFALKKGQYQSYLKTEIIPSSGQVDEKHKQLLKTQLPEITITYEGFKPRKEALALIENSDLLLLLPKWLEKPN